MSIALQKIGYFIGNFFGYKDSWVNIKKDVFFMEKEDVLKLFEDFDIINFKEVERDGKTGLGKIKHWHTFEIIAKNIDGIVPQGNKSHQELLHQMASENNNQLLQNVAFSKYNEYLNLNPLGRDALLITAVINNNIHHVFK